MTRCQYLILASLCFHVNFALAGTIEVGQWIPWKFIAKNFESIPFDFQIQESQMNLNIGELQPKISSIDVAVIGEAQLSRLNAQGILSSQKFSAQLGFGKLTIDQYIQREINGNILRIHIKASCHPFSIQIERIDSSTQFVFVEESRYWRPELSHFEFQIKNEDWSLSQIRCEGIGGLNEEITEQLKNTLNNPQLFQSMLQDLIAHELRRTFQSLWQTAISDTSSELKVSGMQRPNDQGLMVLAEMPTNRAQYIALPSLNESILSHDRAQFMMSTKGFESILEDKIKELAPQNYNLQEVSGFNKLMRSRMKQYFAWPDLRRFPSRTPFWLSTYLDQFRLSLSPMTDNQWIANLQTNGVIKTEIGSSGIDYILMGLGITTQFSIEVREGEIHFSNGNVGMEMYWDYGLIYQLIYRPNRYIAVDIIKKAIIPFFSHQKISQPLPQIKWDNRELKLQNWQRHNDVISMDWL